MKKRTMTLAIITLLGLIGCTSATLTKTHETKRSFAIFDLQVPQHIESSDLTLAIKTALQSASDRVKIFEDLPPASLPEVPSRFRLVSPFGNNTSFSAIAENDYKIPSCHGALVFAKATIIASGNTNSYTQLYTCLWQYKGGYHLDVYSQLDTRNWNPNKPQDVLVRDRWDSYDQFIPRTITRLLANLEQLSTKVALKNAYPAGFIDQLSTSSTQ